jgi:hypothetical protein
VREATDVVRLTESAWRAGGSCPLMVELLQALVRTVAKHAATAIGLPWYRGSRRGTFIVDAPGPIS